MNAVFFMLLCELLDLSHTFLSISLLNALDLALCTLFELNHTHLFDFAFIFISLVNLLLFWSSIVQLLVVPVVLWYKPKRAWNCFEHAIKKA